MFMFVLNADHSVEAMDDPVEWLARYETDDLIVATTFLSEKGQCHVITQFMGLAHGNDSQGRPLVFETMVLKGPMHGRRWRWATYKDAEEGHKRVVQAAREAGEED